jgi:hypothetical protein
MKVLDQFLNAGLLDIGDSDERYEYFSKAATELSKALAKTPSALISYTLVALDPEAAEDEPCFLEAEKRIQASWKTYRNAYSTAPRQILRAVLLEAIAQRVRESPTSASIFYLTAVSLYRCRNYGREAPIIEQLLREASQAHESLYREANQSTVAKELTLEPRGTRPKVNVEALGKGLADATTNGGYIVQSPNYGSLQVQTAWSEKFGANAAEAIAKAINSVSEKLTEGMASELGSLLDLLNGALAPLRQAEAAIKDLSRQSGLLWWMQALYSPRLMSSYRECPPSAVPLTMALDVHELAPPPNPISAAYVVAEAARSVGPDGHYSLGEWLTSLQRPEVRQALQAYKIKAGAADRRSGLLRLAQSIVTGTEYSPALLSAALGLDASLELTPAELAMWCFRDAQAQALTNR